MGRFIDVFCILKDLKKGILLMEPEYLKMEPDSDSDNFKKESPFQTFCSGSMRNSGVCGDFFGLT